MELKRVIALDSRAANEKAMQLYGENVLVISSERVDNQTELIVAVDLEPAFVEDHEEAPVPSGLASLAAASHSSASQSRAPRIETARIHSPDAGMLSFSDWLQQGVEPRTASTSVSKAPAKASAKSRDESADGSPDGPLEKSPQKTSSRTVSRSSAAPETDAAASAHEQLRSREVLALVREEFETLRKELLTARAFSTASASATDARASAAAQALMQDLADLGVPLSLRTQLMLGLEDCEDTLLLVDGVQAALGKALESAIKSARPASVHRARGAKGKGRTTAPDDSTRIEVLIGPSGCGKTSMAVRLAAQAAVTHGAGSQAIVSFCDSRPGAWSQLQTLAALAGVDCWRAQNADSFKVILAELTQHHTVWVDTGGLDYMNTAQVLHELCPQASIHAVLPLDASFTSARRVLARDGLAWSSLMLTKADESGHAWPLIATLCAHPVAVSRMACSARVQTAATSFDPQALAGLALAPLRESCAHLSAAHVDVDVQDHVAASDVDSGAIALAQSTLASLAQRAATFEVAATAHSGSVPRTASAQRKRTSTATEGRKR